MRTKHWFLLALICASVANVIWSGPLAIPLGVLTGVVIWVGWIMPWRIAQLRTEVLPDPEPVHRPRPVSGRPMEECPYPGTLSREYVEDLRRQGHDVSDMEPWIEEER